MIAHTPNCSHDDGGDNNNDDTWPVLDAPQGTLSWHDVQRDDDAMR